MFRTSSVHPQEHLQKLYADFGMWYCAFSVQYIYIYIYIWVRIFDVSDNRRSTACVCACVYVYIYIYMHILAHIYSRVLVKSVLFCE